MNISFNTTFVQNEKVEHDFVSANLVIFKPLQHTRIVEGTVTASLSPNEIVFTSAGRAYIDKNLCGFINHGTGVITLNIGNIHQPLLVNYEYHTENEKKNQIQEEVYCLMRHLNMTYYDAHYLLPEERTWLHNRLMKDSAC